MELKGALVLVASIVAAAAYGQLSPADGAFLKGATEGNRGEVLLGRLAARKGASEDIRKFGQKMVWDHSKALAQVTRLAYDKKVTVPTRPKAEDRELHRRLSLLRGIEFDRAYKKAMIEDHRMDVAEFQRESTRGRDRDVRDWAKKTLPTLRMHLDMIQSARVGR